MSLTDITNNKTRKELTEYQYGEISGLLKAGCHSLVQISDILKIPSSTISDARQRYNQSGTTKPGNKRTGRPPKINSHQKRFLDRKSVV